MLPEANSEAVEPTYVNTQRELDDMIKGMHQWFEGKESEHNWMKREESAAKLRRLIAGNASTDFPDVLVAGCRGLLDGILKAVNSLRTSLSKEGCALVQDLAITFGPGIDPMVELLMQTFIKLCAATKKIASQMANLAVDTLVDRTTYTVRIMQHIWAACQDKNVQPRVYVSGWLKTLLKKEAHHKHHLEHGGGLDLIEKCIKKCLNDPNPGVREKMRSTYWAFAAIWQSRAETLMNGLESTAQKLLQKDPSNPNSPKKTEPVARPGLGLSKSTMSSSKPSLRETVMAQKKALATRTLPARPGSAMATITPVRTAPTTSAASSSTQTATRARPESSMKSHGGMSVAPMRPARRRPEMAARPATAGPYSVRTHDGPSVERSSPESIKSKAITPKTISGSPRRTVPRTRPGHVATASEPSAIVPTPSKAPVSKAVASPRTSPPKAQTTLGHFPSSPSSDENLTFVTAPPIESLKENLQPSSPRIIISPEDVAPQATPAPSQGIVEAPSQGIAQVPSQEIAQAPSQGIVSSPKGAVSSSQRTVSSPKGIFSSPQGIISSSQGIVSSSQGIVASSQGIVASSQGIASPPRADHAPPSAKQTDENTLPFNIPEATPSKPLQVYEDPFVEDQATSQPPPDKPTERPVLEDIPVNEDVGKLSQVLVEIDNTVPPYSPDKTRQHSRLLDSGIARVKGQTLDVHGFRKLQSLIREEQLPFGDDKFNALLVGLFEYLESSLDGLAAQKVQDVKAQVLATIKLLLKLHNDSFQPHVSRGLEALLRTRSCYDARTHIVAGLELLADELVCIGDADEITVTMTRSLGQMDLDTAGYRSMSMGLHVLKELIETRPSFVPTEPEVAGLTGLASRCLESKESGVRMDAVQLCVALHARLGDAKFWESMKTVRDDPKSLITYYVVKRQREAKSTPY